MAIGTPFHSRTSRLCISQQWRDWAGYWAASCYEPQHTVEYFAIRSSAALIDVSPLHKYLVDGPDSLKLMNRIVTKEISKLRIGQVAYTPWCNADGKVLDDGTVTVLRPGRLRVTAAEPNFRWFSLCGAGLDVTITDISSQLAALALQGPTSCDILSALCNRDLSSLRYFHVTEASAGSIPISISRTGYTGDRGYEIWVAPGQAEDLWDRLMDTGKRYGIVPAGIYALDMARVEAGYIMQDVDYMGADRALVPSQFYSPFEIGLGWTVHVEKPMPFVGQKSLASEKSEGSKRKLVGLKIDWDHLERLFDEDGLPPRLTPLAWRSQTPVYSANGHITQIGVATSGTWSPLLKQDLALASIQAKYAGIGQTLHLDRIIAYKLKKVKVTVVKLPFFDPDRKKL